MLGFLRLGHSSVGFLPGRGRGGRTHLLDVLMFKDMSVFNEDVRELGSNADIGWLDGLGNTAMGTGLGFIARAGWILGYFSARLGSLAALFSSENEPGTLTGCCLEDIIHIVSWRFHVKSKFSDTEF